MGNSHIKLSDWIFEEADELLPPDALVAYWKLDGALGAEADSLGTYTLAENGTVPSFEDGLFGNCRGNFSLTDYFEATDTLTDSNFNVSTGSTYAYSMFFKPYAEVMEEQTLLATPGDNTWINYDYDVTEGWSIEALGYDTGIANITNSGLSPTPSYADRWNFVTVAKIGEDGTDQFILLINGSKVDASNSVKYTYLRNNLLIGRKTRGASNIASGIKLCDVEWWYNLTPERVGAADVAGIEAQILSYHAQRYNSGAGKQYTIS